MGRELYMGDPCMGVLQCFENGFKAFHSFVAPTRKLQWGTHVINCNFVVGEAPPHIQRVRTPCKVQRRRWEPAQDGLQALIARGAPAVYLDHVYVHLSMSRYGSFRKLGVPYFGVLMIRILLFRVLY